MQYNGVKNNQYGEFLVSGTEEVIGRDEDNEPVFDGETMKVSVLDPETSDEFGDMDSIQIPMPAHYARRCPNPETHIMSGKPIPCRHRFSFKKCPHCFAENDIGAKRCTECKKEIIDPNNKLVIKSGESVDILPGEIRSISPDSVEYIPSKNIAGRPVLKLMIIANGESMVFYVSKKTVWLFNPLCKANRANPWAISDNYSECIKWKDKPACIRVLKSAVTGRYELKGVIA